MVYRPRLEAIGRRWFSDAYLAEELAQETLVLASRAVGSLREPGAFGAWLVAIARNVARQRWRSRDTLDTAGELAIPATAAVPDPSDLSSLRTALQRASQVLPEPQQQVVELCLREGQTVQEASEMLECVPRRSRYCTGTRGPMMSRPRWCRPRPPTGEDGADRR